MRRESHGDMTGVSSVSTEVSDRRDRSLFHFDGSPRPDINTSVASYRGISGGLVSVQRRVIGPDPPVARRRQASQTSALDEALGQGRSGASPPMVEQPSSPCGVSVSPCGETPLPLWTFYFPLWRRPRVGPAAEISGTGPAKCPPIRVFQLSRFANCEHWPHGRFKGCLPLERTA